MEGDATGGVDSRRLSNSGRDKKNSTTMNSSERILVNYKLDNVQDLTKKSIFTEENKQGVTVV